MTISHDRENRLIPKIIKKLPRYKGLRVIEYAPVVFSAVALCAFVFLPDVPEGTKAIVSIRTNSPVNEMRRHKA